METVFQGFCKGSNSAAELFRANYLIAADRISTVKQVSTKTLKPEIIEVLKDSNQGISAKVDANLKRILQGPSAFAVTGQQLGVLGGPLFTLYKILTTVKVAQELETESGIAVVPLFWMQSEDHDFDEIAQADFLSRSEELIEFSIRHLSSQSGDSVGKIKLDDKITVALKELLQKLGTLDTSISTLLETSYSDKQTLAFAFRNFWQSICAEFGILFFDPSEAEVKKLASPFIAECFDKHSRASELLIEQCSKILKNGFEIQVPVKTDSPLWFISHGGKRERGVLKDGKFKTSVISLELDALKKLILEEPWKFSSSALIRPLFQDWLFPTAAYISGPAEFNYWAELLPLYNLFDIVQPLVVPRASFILVEEKYQNLLAKSGFAIGDVFKSTAEALREQYRSTELDSVKIFSFFETRWSKDLELLKATFAQVDPTLSTPLQRTKDEIFSSLNKLKARYEKALQEKESTKVKQLDRVRAALSPRSQPQERTLAAASFILKFGRTINETILKEIKPFEAYQQKIIYLAPSQIYQNPEKTEK